MDLMVIYLYFQGNPANKIDSGTAEDVEEIKFG